MTQNFKDLLYLFACGALGNKADINHNIDIMEIYKLSVKQGIWHTVFLALNDIKESELLNWGELSFEQLNFDTLQTAMLNQRKLVNVHNFIKKLEDGGVNATVLKGESLSKLYKNPLCRISSDTDLLIDEKLEKKAVAIAEEFGMEVATRNASSNHALARSASTGLVELHIHLYDEMLEDIWFDNKMANQEETITIKTEDNFTINTLGITDGAIFTALHMIKHFLEKGVGVRQMMDTLIYLKNYKNQIDFKRFNDMMKYLKYDKFMDNIIGIGIEYFKFDKEELPKVGYSVTLMEQILNDSENGGVFGYGAESGSDFYEVYSRERFNRFKNGDYDEYMNKLKNANRLKMLFPNRTLLKNKYPYVTKHKWLVPVAWIHRILNKIFKKKQKVTFDNVKNDAIKQRMEMINNLEMI
ncbi:MAG: nucleotidyltransferase family protein [Clostridia bacterium]|nr:nucleotidyltransferase family protein [Clostridia bacterium]